MTEAPNHADYWSEARRPLPCLLFLIPWLFVYEAGIAMLGAGDPERVRNGADFWLRSILSEFGLQNGLLLPAMVIAILLLWHLVRRHPWRMKIETQLGMFAESILLAVALVAVGQLHQLIYLNLGAAGAIDDFSVLSISTDGWSRAVAYIGAGVYEEVMFRLMMVPVAYGMLRMLKFSKGASVVMSALGSAMIFAIAHHVGPTGDAFNMFAFTFRAAAGVFFAAVFFLRGFGITVGCHAAYDLLVGVLLVAPAEV